MPTNENYKESLNAVLQGNRKIKAQFVLLLGAFNTNAMEDAIQWYLNNLKNQIDVFKVIDQALTDPDYIKDPIDKPWKSIILLLIHMSTLDNSISENDQEKLSKIIAELPQDCQDEIKRQINSDDDIYNLLYSAGFNLLKNEKAIPAYFEAINNILEKKVDFTWIKINLDLDNINKELDNIDIASISTGKKTKPALPLDEFESIEDSSTSSDTHATSFLELINANAMKREDWVSLTEALIEGNTSTIVNSTLLKVLSKNHKSDILDAIRSSPDLQKNIHNKWKINGQKTSVYTSNSDPINTTNPLFSILATTKRTQSQQRIGKTKSSLELCSIMGWTIGERRDPKKYLEGKDDSLLKKLIEKINKIDLADFQKELEGIHNWTDHANEKLHVMLLILACTNASFKDKTEVLNKLLLSEAFKIDSFITHLLTLANDAKNWPNLQTILPLTAYLLGKTNAKDLSKSNLAKLSHHEFKRPLLFAIKNNYDTFSPLINKSAPNALNAVIDFHQWKPGLFATKTRASIEALQTKNKPDPSPKRS